MAVIPRAFIPLPMISLTVISLAVISLAVACGGAGAAPEHASPRRVVLITLDTLRLDSFLGGPDRPSSMPRTLARAEAGLIFERFYATTGVTQPSHASMLTGRHPWQHGVTANGQLLSDDELTVPELLRHAGYSTGAVVASYPVASVFGFGQGFDRFLDDFEQRRAGAPDRWEGQPVPEEGFYDRGERVTDRALALLDELAGERQFLWVHYFDPHSPYGDSAGLSAPGPQRILRLAQQGRDYRPALAAARDGYEADVAALDAALDRLLTRLADDAAGIETHIVLAADHGESFGEDGSMGHGKRLSDEQLRAPLAILSPAVKRPQRRLDVAGSVDVASTLVALAGVEVPRRWQVAEGAIGRAIAAGAGGRAPGRQPGMIGRDLLAPPPARADARGMRRAFPAGAEEYRLDGSRHPLRGNLFYLVEPDGTLLVGNGAGLRAPPPGLGQRQHQEAVWLLATIEEALGIYRRLHRTEAPPPGSRRGIEALGYVD